jgi:uncharacterized caspase-like protein
MMPFEGGYALLIGIGSHTYAPYLDVPISVKDAEELSLILTNEAFCGYPAGQVKVLHDSSATREGILSGLAELAEKVNSEDTVTIFYCGHGDYGTDGEYYLVSYDTRISKNKVQAGTGVSQAALVGAIQKIPAKRVLVIFNACHSGEISPTLSVDQTLGSRVMPDSTKDALLSSGSGRIIITACKEEQLSYIGKGDISLFTQAVANGLRGKGIVSRGGYISAYDLYTATYEEVKETVSATYNQVQEPELTVLKGVGPFAVSLYRGAEETNLSLAEGEIDPPAETAVRQISPERSQRMFQVITQTGGVNFGQGNTIDIEGDVIGEQNIDTGGGAFIRGDVNTGGGAFVGRDQTITSETTINQDFTLDQFNEVLQELRNGLAKLALEEPIQSSIESDIASAEITANSPQPSLPVIETRLKGIQSLLETTAGTGAAVIGMVEIIQRGLEMAQALF